RRRHTRSKRDWSSDVCSSDLGGITVRRRVNGQTVGRLHLKQADLLVRGTHKYGQDGGSDRLIGRIAYRRLKVNLPLQVILLKVRSEERRVGKECRRRETTARE